MAARQDDLVTAVANLKIADSTDEPTPSAKLPDALVDASRALSQATKSTAARLRHAPTIIEGGNGHILELASLRRSAAATAAAVTVSSDAVDDCIVKHILSLPTASTVSWSPRILRKLYTKHCSGDHQREHR
jgi:hypothetical protein